MYTEYTLEPGDAFFADPNYWDGHMLGDGDAQASDAPESSRAVSRLVRQTLEENLPKPDEVPLSVLQPDEACHLNDFSEGTIFLFALEQLKKTGWIPTSITNDGTMGPIEGPLPHSPGLMETAVRATHYDGMQYTANAFWGMVLGGEPNNAVMRVSTGAVDRRSGGKASLGAITPTSHRVFETIGGVDHGIRPKDGEYIERVNLLETYYYGQPSGGGRKKRIIPPLPKFGPSVAELRC